MEIISIMFLQKFDYLSIVNKLHVLCCLLGGKNKRSSDSGSFIPSGDGNQGLLSGGVRNTKLMSAAGVYSIFKNQLIAYKICKNV